MKRNTLYNFSGPFILLVLMLVTVGGVENTVENKLENYKLEEELTGAWVYVSQQGENPDSIISGNRIKFIANKHWTITQSDPNTGGTIFHHGGTFEVDGDEYSETIKYANQNTSNMIDQTFNFKMEIKGDTLIQTGVGNNFNEIWKRAD